MDRTPLPPYEWIRWLSGSDAAVLLLYLAQCVEDMTLERSDLIGMLQGWRRNAERAVTADNWKATVDGYVEVTADARMYYFSLDKRERQEMEDDGP